MIKNTNFGQKSEIWSKKTDKSFFFKISSILKLFWFLEHYVNIFPTTVYGFSKISNIFTIQIHHFFRPYFCGGWGPSTVEAWKFLIIALFYQFFEESFKFSHFQIFQIFKYCYLFVLFSFFFRLYLCFLWQKYIFCFNFFTIFKLFFITFFSYFFFHFIFYFRLLFLQCFLKKLSL